MGYIVENVFNHAIIVDICDNIGALTPIQQTLYEICIHLNAIKYRKFRQIE